MTTFERAAVSLISTIPVSLLAFGIDAMHSDFETASDRLAIMTDVSIGLVAAAAVFFAGPKESK